MITAIVQAMPVSEVALLTNGYKKIKLPSGEYRLITPVEDGVPTEFEGYDWMDPTRCFGIRGDKAFRIYPQSIVVLN